MDFSKYEWVKKALVRKYANNHGYAIDVDDLKSEAEVAWLDVIKRYDPSRASFVTFAWKVINSALYIYCLRNTYQVTINPNRMDLVRQNGLLPWHVVLEKAAKKSTELPSQETWIDKKRVYARLCEIFAQVTNGPAAVEWLFSDDLTCAEVAEIYGITLNQVRWAVQDAKKRIAKDSFFKEYMA